MQELNGFKVDKYNQYDIKDNATSSICPLCSHNRKKKTDKCLMVDWNRGLGTCQHCGEVIQLHTYIKSEQKKEYKRPEWKNKTELSNPIVKAFEKRKISQSTLKALKVSEGKEWMPKAKKEINTIQFNYFRDEELINIKYRGANKDFKMCQDAEKIFYNVNSIQHTDSVIIVEGEFDCLSYYECGLTNCISVPNGATINTNNLEYLDNCINYFENKKKIYIVTDKDDAGYSLEKELKRRLGVERCFKVDLKDCNDPNEFLVKYGKEQLRATIEESEPYPIDDIVLMSDDGEKLDDFFVNGMPRGYGIGIEEVDTDFTIDDGRIIAVTGIPTHGKSEFVDQMCVGYNELYGMKTCFCSPENQPVLLHKSKIVQKILGHKPDTPSKEDYKEVKQYIDDNFFFVSFNKGSYDLTRCLDKAKELIYRKGIKILVLDPFNKIRLKESLNKNITDYTNDYLAILDEFARENSVNIFLVAHPKKLQKENGVYPIPDFYEIKGGGEFYDMCPFGLSVYRDFNAKITILKVLKVKFAHLGNNQSEIKLKYNINNGRYSAIDDFGNTEYNNSNILRKEEKQIESQPIESNIEFWNEPQEKEDLPF